MDYDISKGTDTDILIWLATGAVQRVAISD